MIRLFSVAAEEVWTASSKGAGLLDRSHHGRDVRWRYGQGGRGKRRKKIHSSLFKLEEREDGLFGRSPRQEGEGVVQGPVLALATGRGPAFGPASTQELSTKVPKWRRGWALKNEVFDQVLSGSGGATWFMIWTFKFYTVLFGWWDKTWCDENQSRSHS